MSVKDDSKHVTFVETIGILRSEKRIHGPVNGRFMLIFYIGPLKYIAYGKAVEEINKMPAGTRLFVQGKLTDDKEGVVVFVSRHADVTHLFELNQKEIEPLKQAMEEILKPLRFQPDSTLVIPKVEK